MNFGPYPTVRDFVLASYMKEIAFYSSYPNRAVSENTVLSTWSDYIKTLSGQISTHLFSQEGEFHLTHGDLVEGNNIAIRGGKVAALFDWETASFLPFSEAITELLPDAEAELIRFTTVDPVTGRLDPII